MRTLLCFTLILALCPAAPAGEEEIAPDTMQNRLGKWLTEQLTGAGLSDSQAERVTPIMMSLLGRTQIGGVLRMAANLRLAEMYPEALRLAQESPSEANLSQFAECYQARKELGLANDFRRILEYAEARRHTGPPLPDAKETPSPQSDGTSGLQSGFGLELRTVTPELQRGLGLPLGTRGTYVVRGAGRIPTGVVITTVTSAWAPSAGDLLRLFRRAVKVNRGRAQVFLSFWQRKPTGHAANTGRWQLEYRMVWISEAGEGAPDKPQPDLGGGYTYQRSTIESFRALVLDPEWGLGRSPRNAQGLLTAQHRQTGLAFVLIPAGTFTMGSAPGEGVEPDELPAHRVQVPAFLLARTECTEWAWGRVWAVDDHHRGLAPATGKSWLAASAWCRQARGGLRLPTEAEWEHACRAGSTEPWCFGAKESRLRDFGWVIGGDRRGPQLVGELRPNDFGLFDMHGNVREWCQDIYHRDYRGSPTDGSAWLETGPPMVEGRPNFSSPGVRVIRGGSHQSMIEETRSAARRRLGNDNGLGPYGFRPAADLP